MPPREKISRQEILDAAVALTRQQGFDRVTARDVGAMLGTSAKPVYRAFANMTELKQAVVSEAEKALRQGISREMARKRYPPYKAVGMAYTGFARDDPELFRLLFMRNRAQEPQEGDFGDVIPLLQKQTGMERGAAERFHAEMWVCTHGIASMIATGYLPWDEEEISRMLTDFYQGLRRQLSENGEEDHG